MRRWIAQLLEGQERVLGMNRRNHEFIFKLNERKDFPLANDKILAKAFFSQHGIPSARTIATFSSLLEVSQMRKLLDVGISFVVKPALGSQGRGILVIARLLESGAELASGKVISETELIQHLSSVIFGKYSLGRPDVALIEERLIPVRELSAISYKGLPDIRVIVIREKIVMVMLRLPTSVSEGKANLHSGGIGVAVDIATGTTKWAKFGNQFIEHHPDTKEPLLGIQVPRWKELCEISLKIAKHSPLKYIGIDLTVTKDTGPSVLEFNSRPGLEIQNVNKMGILEAIRDESE